MVSATKASLASHLSLGSAAKKTSKPAFMTWALVLILTLCWCLPAFAATGDISITSPSNGATVSNPVTVTASATGYSDVTAMELHDNGKLVYSTSDTAINTTLTLPAGSNRLVAKLRHGLRRRKIQLRPGRGNHQRIGCNASSRICCCSHDHNDISSERYRRRSLQRAAHRYGRDPSLYLG